MLLPEGATSDSCTTRHDINELVGILGKKQNYISRLELFRCYILKLKQCDNCSHWPYLLKIACNRAYLLGINKIEMLRASQELYDHYRSKPIWDSKYHLYSNVDVNEYLRFEDLEFARSAYSSCEWITNAEIKRVARIDLSKFTKREVDSVQKPLRRQYDHERRITALKRYVKKGYTVAQILSKLKENGIGISKTTLYTNQEYFAILSKIRLRKGSIHLTKKDLLLILYCAAIESKRNQRKNTVGGYAN